MKAGTVHCERARIQVYRVAYPDGVPDFLASSRTRADRLSHRAACLNVIGAHLRSRLSLPGLAGEGVARTGQPPEMVISTRPAVAEGIQEG
jgi:hypothetical protein